MKKLLLQIAVYLSFFSFTASGQDYLKRYDKPLTYKQAIKEKDIDFPLPASSHDIYYAMYGDWQAYTRLVRFEAPVADCVKQVDAVIAWDDKLYKRTSAYHRFKVTHVDAPGAGYLDPTPWITPGTIKRGLYAGKESSHTPEIWIDLDRGIFYFKECD